MQRSKVRLSRTTASRLSWMLSFGLLLAGPTIAVHPLYAQQSGTRSDLAIESDVLKALANYPDISNEQITATTQNGVVTLNGSANNSTAGGQAQVVAATVNGVRSVVNHVKVTGSSAAGQPGISTAQQQSRPTLERRSDPVQQAQSSDPDGQQQGDWGQAGPPPDAQDGQVPAAQAQQQDPQVAQQGEGYPIEAPGGQESGGQEPAQPQSVPPPAQTQPVQPPPAQGTPAPPPQYPQQRAPQQYPYPSGGGSGYPDHRSGYPDQRSSYPDQRSSYPDQRSSYPDQRGGYPEPSTPQVRLAATPLIVPERTLLTVRTSEPLDSRHLQGGEPFQAVVAQDIYEGEYLAVPRGAVLEGRVIGVKKPGAFAGGAGFALQIVALNLGGHSYPVVTDTFATDPHGKGGYTTENTIGGAAIGAIIGGIAGRGAGAAIGAAAGGAVGAGASAATPGPRDVMPPETLLTFHLREPLTVNPITYNEVQRLQASVPPPRTRPYAPRPYARPYPAAYGYPPPPPPPHRFPCRSRPAAR